VRGDLCYATAGQVGIQAVRPQALESQIYFRSA